jgi:hypothetical protein
VIVHSTGGLVIREFLRQFCQGKAKNAPVEHLLMMSAANFGSPLAAMGKSVVGRLFKGWGWDHVGQTGQNILNALELASPYTWELAENDLFNPSFKIFEPGNVMVTALAGTTAYDNLRAFVHENGSDGTVRVATANLNAHLLKVNFQKTRQDAEQENKYLCVPCLLNCAPIAFAVFNRNHTAIHDPNQDDPGQDWENTVLRALQVTPETYQQHVDACSAITEKTFKDGLAANQGESKESKKIAARYHQYQHVVFRVRDQFDHPVNDYVVEFYQEHGDDNDAVFLKIHTDILEKVTTNSTDSSYRSFFFDIDDLNQLIQNGKSEIEFSLTAAKLSDRIFYDNPERGILVFSATQKRFIFPNEPLLVDVCLPRNSSKEVFTLKNYSLDNNETKPKET